MCPICDDEAVHEASNQSASIEAEREKVVRKQRAKSERERLRAERRWQTGDGHSQGTE